MGNETNLHTLNDTSWTGERTSQILVRKPSLWPKLILLFGTVALFGFLGLVGIFAWFERKVPPLHTLANYNPWQITTVHDEEDNLIAEWAEQRRRPVSLKAIPQHLLRAVVASEDRSFYEHKGLDYSGIARAFWKNLWRSKGSPKQGGSTITQQTVKTFLLTRKQVYSRKIKEAILARRLEQNLTKDEILYLYLNQIYFGNRCYGVEEASRFYFGKSVQDLTLGESAILAGIPKHPKRYNPAYSIPDTTRRRNYVLKQMYKNRYISYRTYQREIHKPVYPPPPKRSLSAFHRSDFVHVVKQRIVETLQQQQAKKFPHRSPELQKKRAQAVLYRAGLKIETTLRARAQRMGEHVLSRGLASLEQRLRWGGPPIQGALVALEPHTRRVVALVEGRKETPKLRRATRLHHPPGGMFLPFVYAAALGTRKYNASSMIHSGTMKFIRDGEEIQITTRRSPRPNQPIRLREALRHGVETTALRVMDHIGKAPIIHLSNSIGLDTRFATPEAMVHGMFPATLLGLTNAYATFVVRGAFDTPTLLTRVLNNKRKPLFERLPSPERKIEAGVAQLMISLLKGKPLEGTNLKASNVMGYLAMTHQRNNAWWVGCTLHVCLGLWLGFDQSNATFPTNATAASLTQSIAQEWLTLYVSDANGKWVEPPAFTTSNDVVQRFIHKEHGWQVPPSHPQALPEVFLYDALPPLSPSLTIDPP